MQNYKRINKAVVIVGLVVLLFTLTSCRSQTWYNTTYTTWGAEFHFSNVGWAIIGWPVAVLSYPFAWLMHTIGMAIGGSYFWGLVFTTLIVRTVAWPIYSRQNSYQLKMQLLQPEQQRIQNKYRGRTDQASQQKMQQETMKLYKKFKINPLGCVFTMLLQFPIFMAMYEAVRRVNLTTTTTVANGVTEVVKRGPFALPNTELLGYFDLTTSALTTTVLHDRIFGYVIAILFGILTITSQKLAQRKPSYQKDYKAPVVVGQKGQPDQAKSMQTMMYFMNIMFVIFALQSTSLAIYWIIGSAYQILQAQIGRKINEKNYYKMKQEHNL